MRERQAPGFQLVEQVGGPLPACDHTWRYTETLDPSIRVEGSDPHTISLIHKPFDIGVAEVRNAWMWSIPRAEDLRNATIEGQWFRYDGAHMIVSLDGYTYSDLLFRNHGLPRTVNLLDGGDLQMPANPPADAERITDDCILLGDIHNHFGHVLVEAVNRMWYLRYIPATDRNRFKYVFFSTWGALNDSLIVKFLQLYNINLDNVLIIDRQVIFDKLIVPSPAQRPFIGWDVYYSQTMENWYHELRELYLQQHRPTVAPKDKIYLSRGQFIAARQGQRRMTEVEEVETRFKEAGFDIIYPEKLPFEDQVLLSSSAAEIVGPAGSAHHIAAFATNLKRQTILTHPHFFLPVADASFTMMKKAEITYYFGTVDNPNLNSLEADWSIVPEMFEPWFERRYGS